MKMNLKIISSLIAFLPSLALAGFPGFTPEATPLTTVIECTTMGDLRPIKITITSEQKIMSGSTLATLMSTGMQVMSFPLELSPIENNPNVAILSLKTQANGFDPATNQAGPIDITGALQINLNVLTNGSAVPSGEGKLTLNNVQHTQSPRLKPLYELTDCVGLL